MRRLLRSAMTEWMSKTAIISPDQNYRYMLTRRWTPQGRLLPWIMLNPSTADANEDDPTIRRCMGFARDWGYAGIRVVNLFAYRATDPKVLGTVDDPIGPDNNIHLRRVLHEADWGHPIVAAWGADRMVYQREFDLRANRGSEHLRCLGRTKDGHPKHPLYLPKTSVLERW